MTFVSGLSGFFLRGRSVEREELPAAHGGELFKIAVAGGT
jgi:hypothetical protein